MQLVVKLEFKIIVFRRMFRLYKYNYMYIMH